MPVFRRRQPRVTADTPLPTDPSSTWSRERRRTRARCPWCCARLAKVRGPATDRRRSGYPSDEPGTLYLSGVNAVAGLFAPDACLWAVGAAIPIDPATAAARSLRMSLNRFDRRSGRITPSKQPNKVVLEAALILRSGEMAAARSAPGTRFRLARSVCGDDSAAIRIRYCCAVRRWRMITA